MSDGWRSIETAPRDGTDILTWWPQVALDDDCNLTDTVVGGMHVLTAWSGGMWDEPAVLNSVGSSYDDDYEFAEAPTHWQPLPAPPGATPAAPPAREAALVEALRHLVEVMGPPMSLREADAIASARAALAEAEGRAGE